MVTLSLAAHTAAAHGRALVADIDPQANAHDLTQVMTDPGYDVLHELDPMQLSEIRKLRDYDAVLVDCPGSLTGNAVLDEALEHSDYAVPDACPSGQCSGIRHGLTGMTIWSLFA